MSLQPSHPQPHQEPIAIIGIGCRFPGGVKDPDSFWQFLAGGGDAIQEIPPDRIDLETYFDPTPATPGKMSTRWGGFLDQIDAFDAAFFGISPREAERMDPQQRLLLEVAWEALEDAGLPESIYAGTQSGVWIGVWLNDFEARLFRNPAEVDFYMTTGSGRYTIPGRLSYFLGLQGPSVSVDTACSSSLVAVHLACQSLRSGECDLALAGGVNVILQPHITIAYSQSKMMAPDGRCKFGDARADGYVRSEGAGIVVLKRLSQALADGDPIYAVIRGSAVNNDGRSSGYLATPAVQGQEELLRLAYANAGVNPGEVVYVEAHGTGTLAGDPVEIRALGNVLSEGRTAGRKCAIGSVKTNFGHTEGAAGIAGLIKVALSLKNRQVPANLHLSQLNPQIPWDELPLYIPQQLTSLEDFPGPLTGGVSSFGIAGTNAHVVLQEAPQQAGADDLARSTDRAGANNGADRQGWELLALSAHSPEALQAAAQSYRQFLAGDRAPSLRDICYTLSVRRTHHSHRLAVLAQSHEAAATALEAYLAGKPHPDVVYGQADPTRRHKVAFIFPGQGSQWLGMGRELLETHPAFRSTLLAFDQAVRAYAGWSVVEQLTLHPDHPRSRMDEIAVIQPVLLGVEIALAAVWRAWGIEPDGVAGHSMGEVGAAYLAGALSLEQAAQVICLRSQLLQQISGQGAMAVVGLPAAQAEAVIEEYSDRLSIGVSNSFRSTVISGDPQALDQVIKKLQSQDIFCRPVKVDVAAHSPQVEPLREELVRGLAGLQPKPSELPFYSTVTAAVQPGTDLDPAYWSLNLRQPVRFAETTARLLEDGFTIFVELSPHPILLSALDETIHALEKEAVAIPSLRREEPETANLLRSVGRLHAAGYPLDFDRVFPEKGTVVRLPGYPWQRKRYWIPLASARPELQMDGESRHPLLGRRMPDLAHLPGHTIWENRLNSQLRQQLADGGPEAVYRQFALAAASDRYGEKAHAVLDLKALAPLPAEKDVHLQLCLVEESPDCARLQIFSRLKSGESWQELARVRLIPGKAPANWLYHLAWEEKSREQAPSPVAAGEADHWLVFADRGGAGQAVAARLEAQGYSCTLIPPDQLNSATREDFSRILDSLAPDLRNRCTGILYFWGLDLAGGSEQAGLQGLEQAQQAAGYGPLALVQALAQSGWPSLPRLWLVTRGAQVVPSSTEPGGEALDELHPSLVQSLTWGLGRSVALEQPDLWGGLIDLSPGEPISDLADPLVGEVLAPDGETQVVYRAGRRYVPRLAPGPDQPTAFHLQPVRPDATYLITGGLGNIGLALARGLAARGARHIVLTSRQGLPPREGWEAIPPDSPDGRRISRVREIEAAYGAQIEVARADSGDLEQMRALFTAIKQNHPPLRGIFHAAGVTQFLPLLEIEAASFRQALHAKVAGTWVLDHLSRGLSLDFFVLFSSGSAVWGSQGLAHYGAANHYLDVVAAHRAQIGLPALALNWGWWAGDGMVTPAMARLFEGSGLQAMATEEAVDAIFDLAAYGKAQQIVAAVDWETFKPLYEARGPFPLLEKIQVQRGPTGDQESPQHSALIQQLSQVPASKRKELLVEYLRGQVAGILGFSPSEPVDVRQGFFKLGMDSMMTMQLRARLEDGLGCPLPPTLAFEYPSITLMADYLHKEVLPAALGAQTTQPATPAGPEQAPPPEKAAHPAQADSAAQSEPVSGDELLDLLEGELSRIEDLLEDV